MKEPDYDRMVLDAVRTLGGSKVKLSAIVDVVGSHLRVFEHSDLWRLLVGKVERALSKQRSAGFLVLIKGKGGGWALPSDPRGITMVVDFLRSGRSRVNLRKVINGQPDGTCSFHMCTECTDGFRAAWSERTGKLPIKRHGKRKK